MRRRFLSTLSWLVGLWFAALPLCATAQASDRAIEKAEQAEQRLIETERAAVEQRFAAQELACRQRFVVSPCIEDAKRGRRASLLPLRERQIDIDTARRRRASAERKESIAKKAADDGAKPSVSMSSRAGRRAAASTASGAKADLPFAAPVRTATPPSPAKPVTPHPLEPRIGDEAGHRAAYADRQAAAAEHRRDVEARNAEQAKKRKPSAPLATSAASGTGIARSP